MLGLGMSGAQRPFLRSGTYFNLRMVEMRCLGANALRRYSCSGRVFSTQFLECKIYRDGLKLLSKFPVLEPQCRRRLLAFPRSLNRRVFLSCKSLLRRANRCA